MENSLLYLPTKELYENAHPNFKYIYNFKNNNKKNLIKSTNINF